VTVYIIHSYLFKKSIRLAFTPIHPPLGVFHIRHSNFSVLTGSGRYTN